MLSQAGLHGLGKSGQMALQGVAPLRPLLVTMPAFLSTAAPERGPKPLRGPGGGAGGEEWVPRLGDGVWRELGHCGGHGGLPAAGPGVRQQRFPGEKSPPQTPPPSLSLPTSSQPRLPWTFPSYPGGRGQSVIGQEAGTSS